MFDELREINYNLSLSKAVRFAVPMAPTERTVRMTAATALMENVTLLQESASVILAFMGLCKCYTFLSRSPLVAL